MNSKIIIVLIISGLLTIACKDKSSYTKIEGTVTESSSDLHKIVVNEVVDAGTYAYIKVSEGDAEYWMAIPNGPLNVGATYYYNGGMVMKDFISKQLDKTFDEITFAEGIRETEMIAEATHDHAHDHSHDHSNEVVEEELVPMEKIEKAKGGISLEELFSQKKSLSKKTVIVKGKVVKVNDGIMNKNWVHIEDGTQFNGEKDLTITTNEVVKEGAVVTFKGIVQLDKDFGAGYVYDLVVEEAVLIK